jgi:flagellar basal-body rod protein FlgB
VGDRIASTKHFIINAGGLMLGESLFNQSGIPLLSKSLDAGMMRSKAIANNIANVNTPGYKRIEVTFEDELRKALDNSRLQGTRTNEKHLQLGKLDIASINAKVKKPIDPTLPSGVNNVDIDSEMAKLAENQLLFNFSAKFLHGKFTKLNAAIGMKDIQ